jgi:hypothetical protein
LINIDGINISCQSAFNIFLVSPTMPKTQKTPKKPHRERCYLQEAETNVLRELQREWIKLPDKRCRDSFVNATVLPKIQELNKEKFSPEKISRCKDTKKLWEIRVKVSRKYLLQLSGIECTLRLSSDGSKTTNPTRKKRYLR